VSTVLIVGASRGIGLKTVRLALKAGHSVRALSRSATTIRLHDPKLEKLDGNALNQHTIERALAGVTAMVMGPATATPRPIAMGPATATRLTAMVMGPATATRLTGVTDTLITPLSGAISMPPFMVFGVIGTKKPTEASSLLL
jgi:putative NADH-flavin reductase